MAAFLIAAAAILCIIESIFLVKNGLKKELAVFGTLLGLAVLLLVGKKLDWPTPLGLLEKIFSPIGEAIFRD